MQTWLALVVLIVTFSAIWTYFEACRIRDEKLVGLGPDGLPAHSWGALVFLFWPLAMPLFLRARRRAEDAELRFGAPPLTLTGGLTKAGIFGLALSAAALVVLAFFGKWALLPLVLALAGASAFGGRHASFRELEALPLSNLEGWEQVGFRPLAASEVEAEEEEVVYQLDRPASMAQGSPPPAQRSQATSARPAAESAAQQLASAPFSFPAIPPFQAPPPSQVPLSSQLPLSRPQPVGPGNDVRAELRDPVGRDPVVRDPVAEMRLSDSQRVDVRIGPRRADGSLDPRATLAMDDASVLFEVVEADALEVPADSALHQRTLTLPPSSLSAASHPLPAIVTSAAPPGLAPTLISPLPLPVPGSAAPPAAPSSTQRSDPSRPVQPPARPAQPPARTTQPPAPAGPGKSSGPPAFPSYAAAAAPAPNATWIWVVAAVLVVFLLGGFLFFRSEPENASPKPSTDGVVSAPSPPVVETAPSPVALPPPEQNPAQEATKRALAMETWMDEYFQLVGPLGRQVEKIDFSGFSPDSCSLLESVANQARTLSEAPDLAVEDRVRSCFVPALLLVDACRVGEAEAWSALVVEARTCFHGAQSLVDRVYQIQGLLEFDQSPGIERSKASMSGRYLEGLQISGELAVER